MNVCEEVRTRRSNQTPESTTEVLCQNKNSFTLHYKRVERGQEFRYVRRAPWAVGEACEECDSRPQARSRCSDRPPYVYPAGCGPYSVRSFSPRHILQERPFVFEKKKMCVRLFYQKSIYLSIYPRTDEEIPFTGVRSHNTTFKTQFRPRPTFMLPWSWRRVRRRLAWCQPLLLHLLHHAHGNHDHQ